VAARPDGFVALLKTLGRGGSPAAFLFGADAPDGIAQGTQPSAAVTASGGWLRALPAADMAALRGAFASQPPEVVALESDGFLVLFRDTVPGDAVEAPMPPGDVALRVRHHPLLHAFVESSDTLDAGIDLGGGGLDARARLVPGPGSETRDLIASAHKGPIDLLEFLPPTTFLRIETTFSATFPAASVARRLARHLGFADDTDRVVAERFLREVLTGVDPAAGIAIGCEAKGGELSLVAIARDGKGELSPILKKLRADDRSSYGPLVLDRQGQAAGVTRWHLWVAQAEPRIEELPECLWSAVSLLADESKGLPVAYAAFDGWSVLAIGPRAEALARTTRARLLEGSSRTPGANELFRLREEGEGDYVIGIVCEAGLADLPSADLAALRAAFGGTEGARGPKALAAAGFRGKEGLELRVRVFY
jgi:hypothetical protein